METRVEVKGHKNGILSGGEMYWGVVCVHLVCWVLEGVEGDHIHFPQIDHIKASL